MGPAAGPGHLPAAARVVCGDPVAAGSDGRVWAWGSNGHGQLGNGQAGYYPTAGMYLVYAVFVVIGFVVWLRASRTVVETSGTEKTEEVVAA